MSRMTSKAMSRGRRNTTQRERPQVACGREVGGPILLRLMLVGATTASMVAGSAVQSIASAGSGARNDTSRRAERSVASSAMTRANSSAESSNSASSAVMLTANQIHYFAVSAGVKPRLLHFWRNAAGTGEPQSDVWAPKVAMAKVRPTAIAWGDNQYVFSITAKKQLQASSWSPGSGNVSRAIAGGVVAIEPSAMLFQHPVGLQLHAFAVGSDGKLRHMWRDASKSAAWKSDSWGRGKNGEVVTGRPISYAWGQQQHVFATCKDRVGTKVCHWWWEQSRGIQKDIWAGPGAKYQASPTSDVTGFAWGAEQHIFFRVYNADTKSSKVGHVWWDARANRLASDTWGESVTGTPQAVPLAGSRQAVVSRTSAGVVVNTWTPDTRRVTATALSTSGSLAGVPSIIPGITNMTVMGRDTNGNVRIWVRHPDGRATSGVWLGGIKVQS